jgi:hypothetical protein
VSVLWQHYWPVIAAGVIIGAITGTLLFKRLVPTAHDPVSALDTRADDKESQHRNRLLAGLAATIAAALLWHWFAADRLAAKVEAIAKAELEHQEMIGVTARLERPPLRRSIVLAGPADDFQQGELVRIIDELPGVSGVRWATPPSPPIETVK